jgi:hypothetical protein
MKDSSALRPEIFNIKGYIDQKPSDDRDLTEEKILAAGSENAFWKLLKKHFDNSIEQLEQINDTAMAQGLPMEEIGRNAIVISQVKGVLKKIVNVVEDAKEAINGEEK